MECDGIAKCLVCLKVQPAQQSVHIKALQRGIKTLNGTGMRSGIVAQLPESCERKIQS
jgi:hypothetical protein